MTETVEAETMSVIKIVVLRKQLKPMTQSVMIHFLSNHLSEILKAVTQATLSHRLRILYVHLHTNLTYDLLVFAN